MTRPFTGTRRDFRGPRPARGVAAVEFVITVPILILLTLAVFEFGRAWVRYDTLSYNVRSSARLVSECAIAGTSGVVNIDENTCAKPARLLAAYGAAGSGTPILPGFSPDNVTVRDAGGKNIEVSATYEYIPWIGEVFPLFGGESLQINTFAFQISVTMRAIS